MTKLRLLSRELAPALSLLLIACMFFAATPRAVVAQQGRQAQGQQQAERKPFGPLAYRPIGPYRGGRVDAVAGVPSQPMVYYFGAAGGGGVWKTTDGGVTWEPLGDQTF